MTKIREKLKEKNTDFSALFEANLVKIKPLLEKATPTEYTYHGYGHAETLEKNAEQLLGNKIIYRLSEDELFILLNGIYCHDIGMIKYKENQETGNLTVSREDHNLTSYQMIYDKESNAFPQNKIIDVPKQDPRYAKSIALLCIGHRDYENEQGIKIRTIKEMNEIEPFPNGGVHIKFLACIVRLSDELDITNQRAPRDIQMHLKNFINDFSLKQWLEHDLFSQVQIDNETYNITLIPNKDEIKQLDKKNNDRTIARYVMFSKRKKIELELNDLEDILSDKNSEYRIGYDSIKIQFDDDIITRKDFETYQAQVDKVIKEESLQVPDNPERAQNFEESKKFEENDILEDESKIFKLITKEIDNFYDSGQLLEIGSFKLPSNVYSRYYINSHLFLPQNEILNTITDLFYEIYKDNEIDCIIGIDKAGIILAPNLSLKLHCNYTYLIPENEEDSAVVFERNTSIKEAKKIILLTDVISTGKRIQQSIEQVKERFNPQEIVIGSIFCTNKKTKENLSKEYKIYCISDKFMFVTYTEEQMNNDEDLRTEFNLTKLIKK
jgi:orotate phosphoribosyltransferase